MVKKNQRINDKTRVYCMKIGLTAAHRLALYDGLLEGWRDVWKPVKKGGKSVLWLYKVCHLNFEDTTLSIG